MRKFCRILLKTVKWTFIVFFIYVISLFFREERVPGAWAEAFVRRYLPEGFVPHVDSFSFGFRHGLHLRDLRVFDPSSRDPMTPVVSFSALDLQPFSRRVRIFDLRYPSLPDEYYMPGHRCRKGPLEAHFPDLGRLQVEMVHPDVLGIRPERVEFDLEVSSRRIDASRFQLIWPDRDVRAKLNGSCSIDVDRQELLGEVEGLAKQQHIRPLLLAVDVPAVLPYMDGFTDVPSPCPSRCAWKFDFVRSELDLWLDLKPELGKYNSVPMKWANGRIHVHNRSREEGLEFESTVGPITGEDVEGKTLDGTVLIAGTNGYSTVTVRAKSSQPLAALLKIGGFEGDYVGEDVFGNTECDLEFRFPRAMTNNFEVLNGRGHLSVRGGRLMRMKGFKGLIEAMPSVAPAVTWFSDSTEASCDYVITNGVIKSDNVYIEGTCFSIRMDGWLDAAKDVQDFKVTVQFAKKDSMVGKLLRPLTWPFTKLLLEFRLRGSPSEPKWSYVSVIDRVMEVIK